MPKPSLVEYAKTATRPRTCAVCSHSLRGELDAARMQGVTATPMLRWLVAVHADQTLTKANLDYHFAAGHHVE